MARHKSTSLQTWIKACAYYSIIASIIVVIFMTGLANADECPTRCNSCAGGLADCKDRSLTAPPKSYPSTIRIVDLQGNHIRLIGTRSFRRQQHAEILKLGNNKIATIRNDAFRSFPRLMTLDLAGNRITRIYVRAFAGMSTLSTLSLSRNRIRRVAGIFRGTANLAQLNLADNRLAGIQENDLSPLTRMRYLDLRNNMITRIHQRAFDNLSNLRYLFLNNNPIGSAASNLKLGPTMLQLLDMSNCQLTSVPSTMPSTLSEIRMGNNRIMQINYTDFENVTNLQMLTLNSNELHFLADGALTHLTNLKEVWLRNNNLVYVPRNIPPNVIRIYMDSNRIQEIESGLFTADSQLEYFSGANNNIRRINPDTFVGLSSLKTINVQGNQLQVLEPRTFADLDNLESILLSNNPIQRIETDTFKNLTNLTQLSLSYLSPDVMELDYNFFTEMPRLQTLQAMASPGLGQAFVDRVANAQEREFVIMPSMTTVDLSYNNIQSISPRLSVMFPNAQSIFLDGNPFLCAQNLSWMQTWMASDITFHQYDELRCENPYSLRGRTIQSLTAREFREGGAGGETGQYFESRQRSRRTHDESSFRDIENKTDRAPVSTKSVDTSKKEQLTQLELRAQREERRRKVRTRSRSRSRSGKKRKGNGKRRRNRKGRKNKRNGKKRNKKNKSRGNSPV